MNQRMKLKRKKKLPKLNIYLIIFIMVIFFAFIAIKIVDYKATPIIMGYATIETEKLVTLVLTSSVSKVISKDLAVDDLFITIKNDAGEINSIDFNPQTVTKMLSAIGLAIQQNLKKIEQGNIQLLDLSEDTLSNYDIKKLKKGIVYEVPIGVVSKMTLLSNLGPKIPVKFKVVGSVKSNVNTKIKAYGINNALVEVNVHLEVGMEVNLPFSAKKTIVENDIPVAIKIIQGTVPRYYQNGINENSSILTIPIE